MLVDPISESNATMKKEEHGDAPQNGKDMKAYIAAFDWSSTPVGDYDTWPQSLKATIKTLLGSRYPMILLWGESLIQIYNDAYTALIGDKHPYALGHSIKETQAESWETIGPMIRHVMSTGISNWVPEQLLAVNRAGFNEETYFSLSYSVVEDDHNVIKGMLCVCSEVTQQVLGERRLRLQRDLTSKAGEIRELKQVQHDVAAAIGEYPFDVPFMMLYLRQGDQLTLSANVGVDPDSGAFPAQVLLASEQDDHWALLRAFAGEVVITDNIHQTGVAMHGMWNDPVKRSIALPLPSSDPGNPLGVMVAGISPNCVLNEAYRSFYELLAGQLSISIRNALAYEEERKRAEALAELDRAKTAFFNNVSHEFRTPLTLMLGPLEDVLKEPGLSPQSREQLTVTYQNALRLLKLVNSLLDFSRVEANRLVASYTPVDLAAITSELASAFESAVAKAGLHYEIACTPLSETVYIDPEMWEKIMFNLISNALKHTLTGSIHIALEETEAFAVLRVKDTGTGIPKEELSNIFKRFHRVHNNLSRSHEGTGIGLALVKELVALQGGSITVESTEGEGTEFKVTIPKGRAHLDPKRILPADATPISGTLKQSFLSEVNLWQHDDVVESQQNAESLSSTQAQGALILVVDDNPQMLNYLKKILEERWKVEAVRDGREALAFMNRHKPDVVISDVMMPHINGFELLAAIRKNSDWSAIPFILVSARAGKEATVEGLEKGATDYLVKPFSARELIARVSVQLEIRNARSDNALLEKKVQERTMDLNKINKELEDFAYVASHDLQEPLRKITTFSQLLRNTLSSENSQAHLFLNKIAASSERMRILIKDLLNFSRLSDTNVRYEPTDLNLVLKEVISDFELLIGQKDAQISYGDLPVIEAIPLQMGQLFYNLISNALKFTDSSRRPQISVRSFRLSPEEVQQMALLDPAHIYYRIEFRDNGIGFEQQYADRIFTIFQRLNGRTHYNGTGIGLALCKKIVLNHQGEIYVVAKENEGATFIVILPERHLAQKPF
jgi:signal transduction histidine kinase